MKLRRNYGPALLWQQFKALMIKKFVFSKRNMKVTIAQLLVPIIWSTIPGLVINTLPAAGPPVALTLDLSKWVDTRTPYETNNSGSDLQPSYVFFNIFTILTLYFIFKFFEMKSWQPGKTTWMLKWSLLMNLLRNS